MKYQSAATTESPGPLPVAATARRPEEGQGPRRDAAARLSTWRRLVRSPYHLAVCSLAALLVLVAVTAPWIAPYDPLRIDPANRLEPPSARHWFGTDELGRDVFSRVLYGARISLAVSIVPIALAVVAGAIVGTVAGYLGGLVDEIVMRITDIFLAVPLLVLAMAIAAALGPSLRNMVIAVAIVWWPGYTRQVRAQVLVTKELPYVEAARSLGAGTFHLTRRHILPNCVDPVAARMTLDVGYVVLVTASLSFIGLGSVPPTPDWGTMIAVARTYLLSAWTYPTLVGLTISVAVLILTLAGDAVQEAMGTKAMRY